MASTKKKDIKTAQRIEELQSGDGRARREAALWLGRKGIQEAFVPLLTALQDSSWRVRTNAATALGQIGNRDAVEPLIACLSDQTLSVKRAAVNALGALGDVRAVEDLIYFQNHLQLGRDALEALIHIGAPALLHCCQQTQSESLTTRKLAQATAREMLRLDSEPLLKEALRIEAWSGRERWQVLEAMCQVHHSLTFLDSWMWSKFSRIADIPNWCERITRDPNLSDLHAGSRQVLDYIMLGRASQRDHTTDSEELLRAAGGTQSRDTGQTLLRASDRGDEPPIRISFLSRLRVWLGQKG